MSPWHWAGLGIGAMLILLALFGASHAQQDRASWFKSLKQPDTGYSCCDISDCRQTAAEWIGEGWVARLPDGSPVKIPPEKVLETPRTIDGEAYLCSSPTGRVYCFVPPWNGF